MPQLAHAGSITLTTPSDREVVITRDFDAPRQHLFDAFTTPALLMRWMGAPGRSMVVCEIDLKVGGHYRFRWSGDGKKDVGMHGEYRDITMPARLVRTELWEDWDAGELLDTMELTESAGRTTLTSTVLFPSRDIRDMLLKSGYEQGARASYQQLADLVCPAP